MRRVPGPLLRVAACAVVVGASPLAVAHDVAGDAGTPGAARCIEHYHVYFSPPLEGHTPRSGTWGTPDGEPGLVECVGTFAGRDITGSGTTVIHGEYGLLTTAVAGGDTCAAGQMRIMTIAFDITRAAGEHVRFTLGGTLVRLLGGGVVFGHDTATETPVTAVVASQTDQNCASGPVSSIHAVLFRALGVGVPAGILRGDAT